MDKLVVLEILKKDIEEKYKFFHNELEHIRKITEFLGKYKINKKNYEIHKELTEDNNTSLSTAFKKIIPIVQFLYKRLDNVESLYKDLEKSLEDIKDFQAKGKYKIFHLHVANFFKDYTVIKYELDLLTDNFNFLQRKIINIINSFPFYYPTPKVSSYKEASKIHFFLEWISSEFLNILNTTISDFPYKNNLIINSNFYWNFEREVSFIPDIVLPIEDNEKKVLNFVISSDYYLPYRRSYYILIFHECLHFYFKFLDKEYKKTSYMKKNIKKQYPKEFLALREYILGTQAVLNDIGLYLDFDEILDVFIDSILTHLLGKYYYLPLFSNIFLYDENLFINPNLNRNWYNRTKVPLKFLNGNEKESINQVLKSYKYEQINRIKRIETSYIRDEESIKILERYIESYINKNKKFLSNLKEKIERNNNLWVNLLIEYQKEYIDDILRNFYQEKNKSFYEGRTLAFKIHNKLLNAEKKYNIEKIPSKELNIFSFQYIKIRATSDLGDLFIKFLYSNSNNESLQDNENSQELNKYLLNYGSYSFLVILKKDKKETQNYNKGILKKVFSYFHNYELTLFDGNIENFEKDIEKLNNKIFINIKLLLKKDECEYKNIKNNINSGIENIKKEYKIEINPYYFISFDWFDLFISLVIDIEESINLSDLLSKIKEKIITNNNCINRSETEIFLGSETISLLKISNPKLQIRLASGHVSEIFTKINKLFQGFEINYLYGIRDIEIEYRKEINLLTILKKLSDLLKNSENNISDIQFIPSTPTGSRSNET